MSELSKESVNFINNSGLAEAFDSIVAVLIFGDKKHPNNASVERPDSIEYNIGKAYKHGNRHSVAMEIGTSVLDDETNLPQIFHASARFVLASQAFINLEEET